MLLHYDMINEFKKQYYSKVLTLEHLKEGEIQIKKVTIAGEEEESVYNFWGFMLEKDNKKYLLSSTHDDGVERKLSEEFPLLPIHTEKISYRGVVYHVIRKYSVVKFKPLKKMSFRELVDKLDGIEHSNHVHRKLLIMMGLSQLMDRANYRICSPAGFGKDSVVDIMGNLFGGCATIENPTIAKLEYMTSYKWLAISEVVDIGKSEWKKIELFLLATGAHKPEVTKRSRSFQGMGEILDISKFSLSIFYNDINDYPDSDKYFDFVSKSAVRDRFPAFRVHGGFMADFNSIRTVKVKDFVKSHYGEYRDLIYTFTYFKEYFMKELKHFKCDGLCSVPHRWVTNIGRLLKVVDLYCDGQEEFDEWVRVINGCLDDYKCMLKYPELVVKARDRLGSDDYAELLKVVNSTDSFVGKNKLLKDLTVRKPIKDVKFW